MKQTTLDNITQFLAEFAGTAILVFLGCMGCISSGAFEQTHLNMVMNFGLTVMLVVQIFVCVSGCHINPAVTLAAYFYNKISLSMALAYVAAQFLGSFVGYGLLKVLVPKHATGITSNGHGMCVTVPNAEITDLQAFFIEFIITGILIWFICGIWDPRNTAHESITIRFGLTILTLALASAQFTGASMNPARSFGPALWHMDLESYWIYLTAPLAGSLVFVFVYKTVFRREINPKLRTEDLPLN